jgi:hypothetical protein
MHNCKMDDGEEQNDSLLKNPTAKRATSKGFEAGTWDAVKWGTYPIWIVPVKFKDLENKDKYASAILHPQLSM